MEFTPIPPLTNIFAVITVPEPPSCQRQLQPYSTPILGLTQHSCTEKYSWYEENRTRHEPQYQPEAWRRAPHSWLL